MARILFERGGDLELVAINDLADTFGDKVKFTKCNVDDNPVTPGKYGIRAIPTLIFFKDGGVADQITGMVAKSTRPCSSLG